MIVAHKAQTWARNERGYAEQSHPLGQFTLEDQSFS